MKLIRTLGVAIGGMLPLHTMWMPSSRRSMCMIAASTPYDLVLAW
jgi:hypothetical protein